MPFAHVSDGFLRDIYFKLLLLLAPIQSILLTPIQGTTPAFLLTLMAIGFLASTDRRYLKVVIFYGGFWLIYAIYMTISLSGYTIDAPDLSKLTVIREVYVFGYLKQTHLTQGLYLFVAALFTFVVYQYFQESFVKFMFYGILLLSLYGFYEFIFYAIVGVNGDFLSNRNFGDLSTAATGAGEGDFATGSMFQTSNLFGTGFMRIKSLVGEPSMYALTVVPFAVYAFARRWWLIFGVLTLSLILSTATTAIIGLAIGLGYAIVRQRQEAILYIGAVLIISVLLYASSDSVRHGVDTILVQKLDSSSGTDRLRYFINHVSIVTDGNPVRMLFGLGFGTVRATDMLSNLLANVGVIGFFAYSSALLLPCVLLRRGPDRDAVTASLLSIYVMELLSVSEYSYLPPWFMVALGYVRLRQQREANTLGLQG